MDKGQSPLSRLNWRLAYIATLLIPWMLIGFRGGADACCVVVGLLFVWHSYRLRQWRWLQDPVFRVCLLAWAWMIVITPVAVVPAESFSTAIVWVRYPLLYAALRFWVLAERRVLAVAGFNLAFIFGWMMIDTLWQYAYGVSLSGHARQYGGRLSGPMSRLTVGIFLAKLVLPGLGLCLAGSVAAPGYRAQIKYGAGLALFFACLAIILLSGERTAFGSLTLGFLAIAGLLIMGVPAWRGRCLLAIAGLAAVTAILLLTQEWVLARGLFFVETVLHYPESPYGRLAIAGLEVGRRHWLFGAGFKGFRALCPQVMTEEFCNIHPHNPYVEWFAETGIIGLGLFVAMVMLMTRQGWRAFQRGQGVSKLLPAMMLGVVVVNFFPFMGTQSFFSNWPAILLWYSVSLAFALLPDNVEKPEKAL